MGTFAPKEKRPPKKSPGVAKPIPARSAVPEPRSHLLQRTIGNQGAQQLQRQGLGRKNAGIASIVAFQGRLDSAQASLSNQSRTTIPIALQVNTGNTAGEIYEQQADHVADQVMRMPEPTQQSAHVYADTYARYNTEQPVEEHQQPQTKRVRSLDSGQTTPPSVHEVLASPGQPLDRATRAFMEPRFGHDFSRVRVHTGPAAEQSVREVKAHVYTVGHDLAFGADRFAPETHEGRRLLAHELTHVMQTNTIGLMRETDPAAEDPQARLAPAAIDRWQKLYEEMMRFTSELGDAEIASPSSTRKAWLNQLGTVWSQLGAVDNENRLAAVERTYRTWEGRIYDATTAAGERWLDLQDRYHAEVGRLLDEPTLAGIHAVDYLSGIYKETKARIDRAGLDLLIPDDFTQLQSTLADDSHLWLGELRVARERTTELKSMLDVVGALRGAGMNEDKLVPDWADRVFEETSRLTTLMKNAPKQTQRVEFEKLHKDLQASRARALAMRPKSKGLAEKAFDVVKGAVSAVIDPIVEAGKQTADFGQIALHFVTFTQYEPSFVSAVAKAAEKGATTTDLLEGMVTGLIETPERLWKAIQNDDWEAIGRETANLYMLAKSGKQGAAKAVPWIALVRARAAGLRGGMSAGAALGVLKIAREAKLVIRFRMAEKSAIRLRAKGHPAKPEFLKMKSIKEADLHLGAKKADLGKVGYFEPKLPANLERLSADLQSQVKARYASRLEEWNKHKGEVLELEQSGLIERQGQTLADPKSGKAFTSDYDLFDIRQGATRGPSIEYESLPTDVRLHLEAKPIESQHGAHLDWREIPAGQAGNYAEIVLNARPRAGAQPLIEFHPDGKIRYTYFVD